MQIVDFILHLDKYLTLLLQHYGVLVYPILFAVIFCETGLVVTPILPGDSLLFAAGALAAADPMHTLDIWLLGIVLAVAAIGGDNSNYWIGRTIGPRLLRNPNSRVFKPEYLDKTHFFFEKYGTKTIILARFVVIVRTFAPFLAGVGKMHYPRFLSFSVAGGLLWIGSFLGAGYLFGNVPWIKNNLELVVVGIVFFTAIPAVFEYWRHHRGASAAKADGTLGGPGEA